MEFAITITDERTQFDLIADAPASREGVQELIKKFTCMKQAQRETFLISSYRTGEAIYMGNRHHPEARYTIKLIRHRPSEETLLRAIFEDTDLDE